MEYDRLDMFSLAMAATLVTIIAVCDGRQQNDHGSR